MASPAAHLHCVTLRSQATATSAQVARAAEATAQQLRQDASAASLDPEDAPSPAASTSSSTSDGSSFGDCSSPASSVDSTPADRPLYKPAGLVIDHERYPAHPELGSAVRLISARQYAKLADQVAEHCDTPERILFPWLHGADQPHTDQANYFGFKNGARCPTPRYRGLVTVTADAEKPVMTAPLDRLASLGSTSFVSSASIASSLTSSSTDCDSVSSSASSVLLGPESLTAQLCSTLLPDDILDRGSNRFIRPQLPAGVNLRNFRIQAPKYASISDVVVYCEAGAADPAAVALARRIALAQQAALDERRARGEAYALDYRVLLVTDRFEAFEHHHPHLVAIDSYGTPCNRLDFFERERAEMRALTEASEIAPNVFLGNTQDVPQPGVNGTIENPLGFSLCVEAHDQALMSHANALRAFDSHLERVRCTLDERDGVAKPLRGLDVVHLECISTGQACASPLALSAYVDNLVNLVIFLRRHANPASLKAKSSRHSSTGPTVEPGMPPPRRVLIHCQDGYTDSSVLALAYVMQERGCTLPEAYLHMQLTAGRSFFVYPFDRDVLERVEARFARLNREQAAEAAPSPPPAPATTSVRRFFSTTRISPPSLSAAILPRSSQSPSPMSMLERAMAYPWFYDERFDGHFPSRILPFLYLGNLNHAGNALMLKELGITHVVSIGETALVKPETLPHHPSLFARHDGSESKTRPPVNSLWHAHRTGQIDVLDLRGVSDDGIDSIRESIDVANDFIEQARATGGKVLVHCRVGVSRSATLVIAYLMSHLEMDLASAYLLTRSRRLNILIQPTLLFMNALQWHEARLNAERRARGEPVVLGQLCWASLANEVFHLNSRYLSC